ncbi:capsule assembly Wzi family protein, partial [Rhodohalobacter halophilus]|uniref:capsule assembly Wzi family protein n=1 Tax=Rhodohalobacter halophilus TaxID=1812810 RepID=UPI001FE1FFE6
MDYGADLALRVSGNSTAFFPELYLGAEYRAFRLDFGRFNRPIGLNNHNLSIGSMMVSRNAVPIPRIMLSTPEFTDVPWTNDILEFKAMVSHGWFTDERYVDSPYLHQKYLYLKVNATKSLSAVGGIVHNAQWGGTHPTFGRAPQSFSDYLRIVFSRAADPDSNAPPAQITNALGNSVAAYEFALQYEGTGFDLSATRLFYLEDSVSKRFRSPWDGVWGINLEFHDENRLLNALTYEHINTRRQDAKADE